MLPRCVYCRETEWLLITARATEVEHKLLEQVPDAKWLVQPLERGFVISSSHIVFDDKQRGHMEDHLL